MHDTPHVNLYIAGFPCQSYSRLNQKQKEDDPRKRVVDSVLEYIQEKKPDCFVLENVRGLLSSNKGKDWQHITTKLDSLRHTYVWDWRILDACEFDCPMSRPRVWIVGLLKKEGVTHIPWPKPIPRTRSCLDLMDRDLKVDPRRIHD